jgi:hypothetical protein
LHRLLQFAVGVFDGFPGGFDALLGGDERGLRTREHHKCPVVLAASHLQRRLCAESKRSHVCGFLTLIT